jgi:zinc finger protein 830
MADVRALLKAKRQEAPVSHPLASYSSDGRLRCIVCAIVIKHASAWEGHLGSKQHRTAVARVKEEERQQQLQAQRAAASSAKRKSPQDEDDEEYSDTASKKPKLDAEAQQQSNSSLPADFFSDPSRAPVLDGDNDDDEDEDENRPAAQPSVPPAPSTAATTEPSVIDKEWELFQQTVVNAPDATETFERATVFAEPVLNNDALAGFPTQDTDMNDNTAVQPSSELPTAINDEEERRRKQKEQEERELIMDRLLEEERAQEDADMKVASMKARLEALRKKRQNAKAKS